MGKILLIVIDGCALDYLSDETTPNMMRLGKDGFFKTVKSAIPSVTNVNHATILTGSFPEEHGVAGNYFYDPQTGEQAFIEGPGHLKKETILDVYAAQGKSTAILSVKGKVVHVFGSPVETKISVQEPDENLLKRLNLDNPPAVSALAANDWVFNACFNLIQQDDPDFVYCTTNDYMMHNFAPDTQQAKTHMAKIDEWIGKIYDVNHEREIYITADHGMNRKDHLVNMQIKLDAVGFNTVCLLPIKDRYLENHIYQEGGTLYIYSNEPAKNEDLAEYLRTLPFVEKVYDRTEAAKELHLPVDKIGDYVILADSTTVFAETENEDKYIKVRTHGSLHEQTIPLISVNARRDADTYQYSRDIVKFILEDEKIK
ncbi:MAG: alkaline phosphatase family protein [Desulfosporosinus sp.]|nr:alkaline phosphatase family protein [Desulfosporosinus sp.]